MTFNFPASLSAATKTAGDCHACGRQDILHCPVSAIHAALDGCDHCDGTGVMQHMHYAGCANIGLPAHLWIDPRIQVVATEATVHNILPSVVPETLTAGHEQAA